MGPITAMVLSGLCVWLFQAACFAVNNTAGKKHSKQHLKGNHYSNTRKKKTIQQVPNVDH